MPTTAVSTSPRPRPCIGSASPFPDSRCSDRGGGRSATTERTSSARSGRPLSVRPGAGGLAMRFLTMLLALVLAAPLTAEAQKSIKVGMPMPLSGPPALFGEPASKGAQMFVDELNAKGGVLGRKIELLVRDSKADANEAVRVARELILKENVDF